MSETQKAKSKQNDKNGNTPVTKRRVHVQLSGMVM